MCVHSAPTSTPELLVLPFVASPMLVAKASVSRGFMAPPTRFMSAPGLSCSVIQACWNHCPKQHGISIKSCSIEAK